MDTILEVSSVQAAYSEDVNILLGVDMQVQRSSMTVVIGPSGAGKSTTFEIVFGSKLGKFAFWANELTPWAPIKLKIWVWAIFPKPSTFFGS